MSTPPSITPQSFVDKWRSATLKERSAYQEHFIDLCRLIGHPTPAEVDPTGENFAFEYGAAKTTGGHGFADVFKRRYFGWEYKGKHANLDKAYQQLLNYREALQNPPLLVVCDIDRLIIHTNFTNTRKRTRTLLLDDLLTQAGRQALKAVFEQPAFFEQIELPAQVTQQAADRFATLAAHLRTTLPDTSPQTIAHFLIRCLFCLFAEDVDLLHNNVFTKLVELNPPDIGEAELTPSGPRAQSAGHGQKRTLTNLYNARPHGWTTRIANWTKQCSRLMVGRQTSATMRFSHGCCH